MRILTKVVIDIATGETLLEEGYEYSGPIALCKKNEENQFRRETFQNYTDYSQGQLDVQNRLLNMVDTQFGGQQGTIDMMKRALGDPLGAGPGSYRYHPNDPFYHDKGPGAVGAGTGGNGSGGAGGASGGGGGASGGSAFDSLQFPPGFLESDYALQSSVSGLGKMKRAMKSEVLSQTADQFGDAQSALQTRMQQLGQDSGASAALLNKSLAEKAAASAAGLRGVTTKIGEMMNENRRLDSQLAAQLGIAKGDARLKNAAMVSQREMQIAQARQAAAARSAAIRAASANASAARQMQTAAMRQSAFEFAQKMGLAGAQLKSDNFFKSIAALQGAAGLQDPSAFLQGAYGAGGQAGQGYGNIWQGTQPIQQGGMWGKIGGALLGGALNVATGGLSGLVGGLFGGGGGGSNTLNYSHGSPSGGYWG